MTHTETPILKANTKDLVDKNLKGIKNHRKAAAHLEAAAKYHLEAATYHQDGNHEKAAKSTIAAHGHVKLAKKAQKRDVKQHAMYG